MPNILKLKRESVSSGLLALSIFLLAMALYGLLFVFDNKYTSGAPYGSNGTFEFSQNDLQSERPMFLIDGWELYPDAVYTPSDFARNSVSPPRYTFIGQFPNFSFFAPGHSPFGQATYRIVLSYNGPSEMLSMEIPEIFTEYTLWINGAAVAVTGDSGLISFAAAEKTEIVLNTENRTHYYSGLTYPPALGTAKTIGRMLLLRSIFYAVLFIVPLALSLFAAVSLFAKGYDKRFLHFGLLCLFFGLRSAYPFVSWIGLSGRVWYTIEDVFSMAALCETVALCALECDVHIKPLFKKIVRPLTIVFCFFTAISVFFIIPVVGEFINIYGAIVDLYKLVCFAYLVSCSVYGRIHRHKGSSYILAVCGVMGASLLLQIMGNSRYEPVYGGWQTDYAYAFFVIAFAVLVVKHIRNLLKINRELTVNLTAQVALRTQELQNVLDERKAFFSNMAHDMKAPITAISGFASLILQDNSSLNDDFKGYITRINGESEELSRRVRSLGNLNDFDKIDEPSERISLNMLLQEVHKNNEPEANVRGIYLTLQKASVEGYITGVRQKLLIMFENLIYNAIAFTAEDGHINICANIENDFAVVTVSDTGIGIAPEHLPHIFERFYVGREKKSEGSGLGLYIARLTATEMGASISAASVLGEGTVFTIKFPFQII